MASSPTPSDAHVNRPLTEISIAWFQQAEGYIAPKVFPIVPVTKQSDIIPQYEKGALLRSEAKPRAPGTESAGRTHDINTDETYFCKPIAVHEDVDDQYRANADDWLEPDRDATEIVSQDLAIRRERDWGTGFFATGIWTGSTTGGDVTPTVKWDAGGSVPIDDMTAQIAAVQEKTGFDPNFVVMPKKVWDVVKQHAQFLDRIKGGAMSDRPAIVRPNLLAQLLEVENVHIAKAVHNTAAEDATDTIAHIILNHVLVGFAQPRPSRRRPSAGYIFSWRGYLGAAGPQGNVIKRFRMEELEADRVEGKMAYDMKQIAPELGALLINVLT